MWNSQKTMSNTAVLKWERLINSESCTPKREITLADLKEKQCRWNTLYLLQFRCDQTQKKGEIYNLEIYSYFI